MRDILCASHSSRFYHLLETVNDSVRKSV
jgi:hypothetical protein